MSEPEPESPETPEPESPEPRYHGKGGHTRVNMLWPDELKEQVRDLVGHRGLTKFTLDAVQAKLSNQIPAGELTEARELAQRLADAVVVFGDDSQHDELVEVLDDIAREKGEKGLPPWFNTVGWPVRLVELVTAGDEYRPGELSEDELPWAVPSRGMETVDLPQDGVPNTVPDAVMAPGGKPGDKAAKEDLFERIQRQGRELGIELKPASQVRKHARPSITVPVAPSPEPRLEPPAPKPDTCPNCGSVRVDGECWECDL